MSASTSARTSASRSTGSRGWQQRLCASTCLGHPRRQQRQRQIRLPDDEVRYAGVTLRHRLPRRFHRCAGETDRGSEPLSPDTRQYDAASTGVGKTHLAVAIGRQAILTGHTVLFVPSPTWSPSSPRRTARAARRPPYSLWQSELLIVDELGYLPFEPDAAHLFFQLVVAALRTGQPR